MAGLAVHAVSVVTYSKLDSTLHSERLLTFGHKDVSEHVKGWKAKVPGENSSHALVE